MSLIAFSDLCDPCRDFVEGLVAHWTYGVENALTFSLRRFESLADARVFVNEVWALQAEKHSYVCRFGEVVHPMPGPPKVVGLEKPYYNSVTGHYSNGRYDCVSHEVRIAPERAMYYYDVVLSP